MAIRTEPAPDRVGPQGGRSASVGRGWRLTAIIGAAVLIVGALSACLALVLSGGSGSASSSYSYYQSMIANVGSSSMMGADVPGWMMGQSGYSWMIGGRDAPGWMRGGSLPGSMMGSNDDPGQVMGQFWANSPGPRMSSSAAVRLGDQTPAGATVDRAANRLTFAGKEIYLFVLASPSMPNENFRIAGMTNPSVAVPVGATVTIELINADSDMAHGLVVTTNGAASSDMPMMSDPPAFSGAALWLLGEPTSAGMHAGTLSFTATTTGTYQYLCPVPGHAQQGMVGSFIVET